MIIISNIKAMKENLVIRGLGLVALIGAIVLTALLLVWNTQRVQGSVDNDSSGYYSTSTPKAVAYAAGRTVLRTGQGILGSVLFTGAPKGGRITLYNATTTDSTLRTGNKATSTIILAEFDAGQATSSVYVLDVTFTDGLLLETSAAPATSTITWK